MANTVVSLVVPPLMEPVVSVLLDKFVLPLENVFLLLVHLIAEMELNVVMMDVVEAVVHAKMDMLASLISKNAERLNHATISDHFAEMELMETLAALLNNTVDLIANATSSLLHSWIWSSVLKICNHPLLKTMKFPLLHVL